MQRLKGNLIQQVVNAGFSVFVIDSDSSWQIEGEEECLEHCAWLGGSQADDALQTAQVLKRTNASWLVVDHYAIGSQWHQVVRPFCDKILVIDDLGDRQLDCDVLLDPTLFAKPSKFENLTKAELLLGAEFAPLRSEFRNFRSSSLEYRDNGGGLNDF